MVSRMGDPSPASHPTSESLFQISDKAEIYHRFVLPKEDPKTCNLESADLESLSSAELTRIVTVIKLENTFRKNKINCFYPRGIG